MNSLIMKVPYELLNKKFRSIQKTLDRDVTQVINSGSELSQCVTGPAGASFEVVSGYLKTMEQRVMTLKRKANESLDEEMEYTRLCKSRLDHLKSYVSGMVSGYMVSGYMFGKRFYF